MDKYLMADGSLQFDPRALYFSEIGLYLDGRIPQRMAFISHAHADHFARHEQILCSERTAELLRKRFGVDGSSITALPWGDTHEMGEHTISLFPAGHISGSAMIHVSNDDQSLLYTGDFKMRESYTAECAEFPQADILVMESTFGLDKYVFPSPSQVRAELVNFVQAALADQCVPIVLGYALGKAQEAHAILAEAGIPVVLHRTVYDMALAYNELGLRKLPDVQKAEKKIPPGHVLIAPPNAARSREVRNMRNKRTIMLSGWALDPSAIYRYQTDAVLPLSDHADFPSLLEAVEQVKPKTVYTVHGFTRQFAAELRTRGYEAWSAYGDDQLELFNSVNRHPLKGLDDARAMDRPDCGFQQFTDMLNSVAAEDSRLGKVEILSEYLISLQEVELEIVVNWIKETRANRIGPAVIKQSVIKASDQPLAVYKTVSSQQNDAARTARILLEKADLAPRTKSLVELHDAIKLVHETCVQLEKVSRLVRVLKNCHPMDGETVVRVVGGGIRAGVKDGLTEEAISKAFRVSAKAVRRAHMLTGSLSKTALLAKERALHQASLRVGTALKPMLASPTKNVDEVLKWYDQLDDSGDLWVEEKFDGIRAQLHVTGEHVHLYSRDLKPLGNQFPELIKAAHGMQPCILDGEIIAYDPSLDGAKLTFHDMQKRLGKKHHGIQQGDLFGGAAVPVTFIAFDCIWSSQITHGENMFERSLGQRRAALENLPLEYPYQRIEVQRIAREDVQALEEAFKNALANDNEGLIIKDERSAYQPGSRGKAWIKLKGVMPTLDCVVIAAQQGHGKRAGVLSDYTFAVRDDETGDLVTLGKAYSGLTDEMIEELTLHFQRTTIGKPRRRVHEVEPTVILEIAFDRISASKRHNSGLALRFPRIKAVRRDKTLDEIDTLSTARSLVKK